MRNLLSVNICRFSLNIHFSWAFILAKLLCYNISDLKHRQKAGKTSQHSMESACWIHPGLLLCCFAQPLISLLVWRLKVAFSGNRREWEKNGCLCKSVAGSVSLSCAWPAHATLPVVALHWQLWSIPLRNHRLLAFFNFFFFFLNSLAVELYEVTQAKYVKAWKPWRHYLFIFTNSTISHFRCFEVVL